MRTLHGVTGAILALFLMGAPSMASADELVGASVCGELKNHYGPYDYRTSGQERRDLVDTNHFTAKVENLTAGETSMGPGGDLTYTLRVFPNHPRALMSVMRWAVRTKSDRLPGLQYTVPCWFYRGEQFAPDDSIVKVIHGIYLIKRGSAKAAIEKLEEARALDSSNPNVFYNLGLAYFDLKMYDKALESAHAAYRLGFPLPGLRNMLARVNQWHDPAPVTPNPESARAPATRETDENSRD